MNMKRRSFLKASVITTAAGAIFPKGGKAAKNMNVTGREFYELRVYSLKGPEQQKLVEGLFSICSYPGLKPAREQKI